MPYLDYTAIRRQIPIVRVLGLIGWRHVRVEAGWLRGPCPYHPSAPARADCFAVCDLGWVCHKCGRHGDQLRLWAELTGQALYPATVDLCGRLGVELSLRKSGAGQRFRQ